MQLITKKQALFAVSAKMIPFLMAGETVPTEGGLFRVGTVRVGAVRRYFIEERPLPLERRKPNPAPKIDTAPPRNGAVGSVDAPRGSVGRSGGLSAISGLQKGQEIVLGSAVADHDDQGYGISRPRASLKGVSRASLKASALDAKRYADNPQGWTRTEKAVVDLLGVNIQNKKTRRKGLKRAQAIIKDLEANARKSADQMTPDEIVTEFKWWQTLKTADKAAFMKFIRIYNRPPHKYTAQAGLAAWEKVQRATSGVKRLSADALKAIDFWTPVKS